MNTNSNLSLSAAEEQIQNVVSDERFRTIKSLEAEELLAIREIAVATATAKRNRIYRTRLMRELEREYSTPEVVSLVADPERKSFPYGKVAIAALSLATVASLFVCWRTFANRGDFDPKPTTTVSVATKMAEAVSPGVKTAEAKEVAKQLTPDEVERVIRELAAKRGFKWPDYLVRLARCESGLRADAVNVHGNVPAGSKDRGVFQINDFHHKEVSDATAFDLTKATEWTMWRIESGHQSEWMCDGKARNSK